MESKNRGINQQHSSHIPQSSDYGYFTEQSHPAGYMGQELRWTQHGYNQSDHPHSHPLLHPHPHHLLHPHPHPHDIHGAIRREIEKQMIREEIITSEIARRRVLEAEVRRELMMERELALQRGRDGFPFSSSRVMGFDSPMGLSLMGTRAEGWSVEERIGMPLEDERLKGGDECGRYETLPFQRGTANPRISEVKPASNGSKEQEKIVLLPKPDENISRSKRKAVTPPPEMDDTADVISKKKSKEEWSCALCQVSATSEKGLDEHLCGKKHKSKEAALRAERGGKNYSIGLLPKKTKSICNLGTSDPRIEEGVTFTAEPLLLRKSAEAASKRGDLSPTQENPKAYNLKKNQSDVVQKVQANGEPKKKNYRFWCEMCQVGTISQKVMNAHKKGKKHVGRLQKVEQNGGTGPSTQKKIAIPMNLAEDRKSLASDNVNEALDEVRSEDRDLLGAIEPEGDEPVGVTKEEEYGAVLITKQEQEDELTNDKDKPKDDDSSFS